MSPQVRTTILVAAITVAAVMPLAIGAQQRNVPAAAATEEHRVLAVEDEYAAAQVSRDVAALRRLVDDRFVNNSIAGTTSGKEDLIRAVLKMRMLGQTFRERSVLIDGDIALVFGTADLRLPDPDKGERVSSLRYTSTYVKRKGQWRMLAVQMQQRSNQ